VGFTVVVPDVEELTAGDPEAVAVENAERKARAVQGSDPAHPVLGVDTVVVLDGMVYGKPVDAEQARAMLSRLSGRDHTVVSGIAVAQDGAVRTASARTRVRFRALAPETLDWYVATGEWRERAGGYAIQGRGAALVAELEGDYLNVVGLPVAALIDLLPGIVHGHP
jgi:septum formation protein